MDKRKTNNPTAGPGLKSRKNRKLLIIVALCVVLAGVAAAVVMMTTGTQTVQEVKEIHGQQNVEPQFRKDGELRFLNAADESIRKRIDIEIADDEPSRNRGLMFRRSMPDSAGMLFIFDDSRPLSFWMENTYIPLDIIFADENMKIVTIQKNTVPFSKTSVPSSSNAQYVIEVNAGFTDSYGIKEGDRVTYERSK